MEIINKKTLEKLAELGRIKINADKEEKLLSDLGAIFGHFEELKEVNIADIEPIVADIESMTMAGAVDINNVFRNDEPIKSESESEDLISAFSEKEGRFLKVPGVFNN